MSQKQAKRNLKINARNQGKNARHYSSTEA